MTRIAIIAALDREIASLVAGSGWRRDAKAHPRGVSVWISDEAVVAVAGMGEGRAALAFEAALSVGAVQKSSRRGGRGLAFQECEWARWSSLRR